MDEVILEYRRVMCDLMWRSLIRKPPEIFNFITWNGINDIHELTTSEMEKLCTEMENFTVFTKSHVYCSWCASYSRNLIKIYCRRQKIFSLEQFCLHFGYILPEVYQAMECVVVECINISNMNLFVSNYGKSMHLSEFESQQQQEIGTVIKYLKEMWLERITQSVRLYLRDVGKGWFDIG